MFPRAYGLALGAAVVLAGERRALANGRFPAAQHLVVGPSGDDRSVLALQTTFGVEISDDGGRTFRHTCEGAIGFANSFDPPIVFARDGTLVVGLPDGLALSRPPYCAYERNAMVPSIEIIDLAQDTSRDRVVAVGLGLASADARVFLSDDRGASWREGWFGPGFYVLTVDFAPSNPQRLYASGYAAPTMTTPTGPILYRSDDGGMSFTEVTRNFREGRDAYIAAVDPMNPDVVYVRSNLAGQSGTLLLRSEDGGGNFTEVHRTQGRMTGFAMAPDGQRIWVGSTLGTESVQRSLDRGAHWEVVARGFPALCLRYQAGSLYVCGHPYSDFALQCSTDDGGRFETLLGYPDILGPEACSAGSAVREMCTATWPSTRGQIVIDGGLPAGPRCPSCVSHPLCDAGAEAGSDAGMDAATDGAMDAGEGDGARVDSARSPSLGGSGACSCRAAPGAMHGGHRAGAGAIGLVLAGILARERSRRRARS